MAQDDLSELFESPVVTIVGFEESLADIQRACETIFGRQLQAEEFAELVAAPNNSELAVEAIGGGDTVELQLSYEWFSEAHEYIIYVEPVSGKRIVEFVNIAVKGEAPYLLETHLFARQVRSFRKFGLDEVRLYADGHAGHPSLVGYYVWARLGFIMYLDGFGPRLAEAGFQADNTLQLFARNGGGDWWYTNGSSREAYFYLNEGSPCLVALEAYLAEKEIVLDGGINHKI